MWFLIKTFTVMDKKNPNLLREQNMEKKMEYIRTSPLPCSHVKFLMKYKGKPVCHAYREARDHFSSLHEAWPSRMSVIGFLREN